MYDIMGYEGALFAPPSGVFLVLVECVFELWSLWCTGILLNKVYFGVLIPHEKGVYLDTNPGHDGRL